MTDANCFIQSIENSQNNVNVLMNSGVAKTIEDNRHIIKCCAQSVIFCGRQCIALRGDTETLKHTGNPGNFLAFLKVLATHDLALKAHLDSPRLKNTTYLLPQIQNEIVEIVGKNMIQKR